MPHVAFVPFTGLRVKEQELLALAETYDPDQRPDDNFARSF